MTTFSSRIFPSFYEFASKFVKLGNTLLFFHKIKTVHQS